MLKETKDLINKRKIAYVYLLHRMFEGSPALMLKVMRFPDVTVAELEDWNIDWKEAVYKVIEEEDANGVKMKDPNSDVPSIKGIKEKLLRKVDASIQATDDPARLAQTYKILSEFEKADDRKDKSVLDAINESVTPRSSKRGPKPKTMLEKMRQQGMAKEVPAEDAETDGDNENEVEE